MGSHIYLLVNINTVNDKEDPWAPGSSCEKATQSEDDGPLVLLISITVLKSEATVTLLPYLDHLHDKYEAEGEGGHYQHQREDGEGQGTDPRTFLACCGEEE